MIYSQEAIDLSNRLFYRKGLALALKNIGLAYYVKSDYSSVLSYWQKSLEEYQNIGDNYGIGNLLNNIGAVYYNLGDNPKALEYYLESLKVSEKEGNQLRILTALTNIGAVYSRNETTYDKAESYLLRALPLAEELGDQNAVGTISVNLGDLFLDEGKLEEAIKYFEKALVQMREKGGNESYVLSSMGEAYLMQNNYKKALEYQNMAFQKANKIDAKLEKIIALNGIGDTYFSPGE
jgi:tetratricopeptide (TPR) repeat protein